MIDLLAGFDCSFNSTVLSISMRFGHWNGFSEMSAVQASISLLVSVCPADKTN